MQKSNENIERNFFLQHILKIISIPGQILEKVKEQVVEADAELGNSAFCSNGESLTFQYIMLLMPAHL